MKYLSRWTLVLMMSIALAACGDSGSDDANNGEAWDTDEKNNGAADMSTFDPDMGVEPDLPPDVDPDPGKPDGSTCTDDEECAGGTCRTGPSWPDGYCTTSGCNSVCEGDSSTCVDDPDFGNFCGQSCASDDDCRDGYACSPLGSSGDSVCAPPTGKADGEACTVDGECGGGHCITDWPDGYCTTLYCDTFEDCARLGNDNKCLRNPRGPDMCVRICTSDDDCRDQYVCQLFGNGEGMCAPDPAQPLDPAVLGDTPLDVACSPTLNGTSVLDFSVGQDTTSYMITPVDEAGKSLAPKNITRPTGTAIDFEGANWFQSVPSQIYAGGMNPTIVPATADFVDQLEPGDHQYTLLSESPELCYYMLEETEPGTKIDFNIYLVGLNELDAAAAPDDANLQAALDQFDLIWADAGYSIGKVRYFDISGDDADKYSIIRSDGDVSKLVSLTKKPGDTVDDVLSANVFFVQSFALGGAIGISLGLPGPAGLHGSHGSGVAFTSEYLGKQVPSRLSGDLVDGNIFTGQVLAHEVGHYIGLFHTSEQNGYNHDPLSDTPECQQISLQCPDINNLMFPFAGIDHTIVTQDQSFVMGVNPLTKTPPSVDGGN